jgi:hypothetical protein
MVTWACMHGLFLQRTFRQVWLPAWACFGLGLNTLVSEVRISMKCSGNFPIYFKACTRAIIASLDCLGHSPMAPGVSPGRTKKLVLLMTTSLPFSCTVTGSSRRLMVKEVGTGNVELAGASTWAKAARKSMEGAVTISTARTNMIIAQVEEALSIRTELKGIMLTD